MARKHQFIRKGVPEDSSALIVDFIVDGRCTPVYFRCRDSAFSASNEALLTFITLPSMSVGGEIVVEEPVCEQLLASLPALSKTFSSWYANLMPVEVVGATPVRFSRGEPKGRTGAFFSGGVDSFYTLLRHHEEITDLILVHGFDIPADDYSLYTKVSSRMRAVAEHFGKGFVEVETNVRSFLDKHADWPKVAHGAALAGVGHLLASGFRRIYIPGSHGPGICVPWGSHPDTDPLWGSHRLAITHDEDGSTRIDKLMLIAQSAVALDNLRVCWENPNGAYNCGRCEKCLRTMLSLHAVCALEKCRAFDAKLTVAAIRKAIPLSHFQRTQFGDVATYLRAVGHSHEYTAAIEHILSRPVWCGKLMNKAHAVRKRLGFL